MRLSVLRTLADRDVRAPSPLSVTDLMRLALTLNYSADGKIDSPK
jgi:hypothetical protein